MKPDTVKNFWTTRCGAANKKAGRFERIFRQNPFPVYSGSANVHTEPPAGTLADA
jgi:hypothetical protein